MGYKYLVCLLIFLSYVLVFFHRLCAAVIALDMQVAFEVSGTLLGVLGSAYFYPYAIMQLPAGLLADSWGPRKTVSAFFSLAATGSILMGIAPNLGIAILGRVLVGLGLSTLFVSNFKLLAEWFPPSQFVIMGGFFMAMGGVGALSASAPLAWISNLIGWRMTLGAVGLVTLIMTLLIYSFVRDKPSDLGLPSIGTTLDAGLNKGTSLWEGIKLVVASGRVWPISIWSFCACGISFTVGGLWGGPYLIQVYGLSKPAAGGVLSMFAVALIAGNLSLSWIADRIGRKPVLIACSVILISVCSIFYGFTNRLTLPMLYTLFFFLYLTGPGAGSLVVAVSKELFPLFIAGTSVGVVNFFPFFGAALFQILVGAILARAGQDGEVYSLAGYQDMFLVYLLAAVISLVSAVLLRETLASKTAPHPDNPSGGSPGMGKQIQRGEMSVKSLEVSSGKAEFKTGDNDM